MIERIMARREELMRKLLQAQQQYSELEGTLHTLDRQLCAMHGGIQELDALLADGAADETHAVPPRSSP
jgi:DNA repair exonuclease SbcCD ATPase subunit